MKHIWHYLKEVNINTLKDTKKLGNRESGDMPLIVNCAGKINRLGKNENNNPNGRLDF